MGDTTVKKIDSAHSPKGECGQKYLASGKSLSMRLWEEEPVEEAKQESERDYETVGYVIKGRAELHSEGQMVSLGAGDSWTVPKGARHTYKILESFTAIEATSPPAEVHGRDGKPESKCEQTQEESNACDSKGESGNGGAQNESQDAGNGGPKAQSQEAGNDDAKEKPQESAQPSEDKTHHAQEVAAQIPRTSENITSNAPDRTPAPSEKVEFEHEEKKPH